MRRRDRGMVTAETAVVLPVVVLVAVVCVWLASLGIAQVRLVDAAREAARMTARGETVDAARERASEIAPDGASVEVDTRDDRVVVTVSVGRSLDLPGLDDLGGVDLSATSVSAVESTGTTGPTGPGGAG